jgi:hypothetical protein
MNHTAQLLDAQETARKHMSAGINDIDKQFGKGYAKEHPELLAAYMQTAILDWNTTGQNVEEALNAVATAIGNLGFGSINAMGPLERLAVETCNVAAAQEAIAEALKTIAEAIKQHENLTTGEP